MSGSRSVFMRACVLAAAIVVPAGAQVATPPMVGHWKGDAEIAVNWTKQRTLSVDIVISREDGVTGTVGDARIVGGRLLSNRSWITRRLGWKTDFIIDGKLDGPIIAAEDIVRDDLKMPLNWKEGHFEGGVNTSGSAFGGAGSMVLAAGKLVLHRVPEMVVCSKGTAEKSC